MFQDDTPLNADAVVKHFDRLQDPATACPCKTTVDIIESMDTPDGPEGLTVVFNLATPSVAFPDLLAGSSGYIESPTAVADGVNLKTDGVGTGPFILDEFVAGERTVLVKNPDYWGTDEDGNQLPVPRQADDPPDPGQRPAPRRPSRPVTSTSSRRADSAHRQAGPRTRASPPRRSAAPAPPSSCSTTTSRRSTTSGPARPWPTPSTRTSSTSGPTTACRVPSYSGFALDSAYYNPDAGTPQYDPDKAKELVDELGGLEFELICIPTPESELITNIIKQHGRGGRHEDHARSTRSRAPT